MRAVGRWLEAKMQGGQQRRGRRIVLTVCVRLAHQEPRVRNTIKRGPVSGHTC